MLTATEAHMRRERKRGHPTEQLGFRCPEELMRAIEGEGPDKSAAAIAMLDRAADAKTELGKDWIEVVVLAHREGVTEGQALARLAKLGLKAKK